MDWWIFPMMWGGPRCRSPEVGPLLIERMSTLPSSPAGVLHVIYAHAHLASVDPGEDVLALRPDVYQEALARWTDRVLDISAFLSARAAFHEGLRAVRLASAFARQAQQRQPELEAVGIMEVNRAINLFNLYQRVLGRALECYREVRIAAAAEPEPEHWRTWSEIHVVTGLYAAASACAQSASGRVWWAGQPLPVRRDHPIRDARAGVGRLILWLLDRCPALVTRRGSGVDLPAGRVLVGGLQPTDAVLQTPLVSALTARVGGVVWLRLPVQGDRLVVEEQQAAGRSVPARIVDPAQVPDLCWRCDALRRLAAAAVTRRAARWLAEGAPLDILQDLLLFMVRYDAPREVVRWRRALRACGYGLLVMSSRLAQMGALAVAARKERVETLLVPHAPLGEVPKHLHGFKAADHAMAVGHYMERLYRSSAQYERPRSVGRIGNYFAGPGTQAEAGPGTELLFLETGDFSLPFQTSPSALVRVLERVRVAAQAEDLSVVFRPHPRFDTAPFYQAAVRRWQAGGGRGRVDRGADLGAALADARCVVALALDTACLKAMRAEVPVIVLNPWPAWYTGERLGRRATGFDPVRGDLARAVRDLAPGRPERTAWLRRQQAFLSDFLDEAAPGPGERLADQVSTLLSGVVR